VHISLEWQTEYHPHRWSFGYCPSCQEAGLVRLDRVEEVCYLWGMFPVDTQDTEQTAPRCDFCRRLVEQVFHAKGIALDKWSPVEGITALLDRLDLADRVLPPEDASSDARLHSLLTSVAQESSIFQFGLSPIGMFAGLILGVLAAVPLGKWLFAAGYVEPPPDEIRFVMIMCMIGAVVGVLLGATTEFLIRRNRSAHARIAEACRQYHLDPERLEEVSRSYNRRLQKLVKRVVGKATLRY
jgi:hypothetical protein